MTCSALLRLLKAFLPERRKNIWRCTAFFDNEETGSETKQGAASTFLYDTLVRVQ